MDTTVQGAAAGEPIGASIDDSGFVPSFSDAARPLAEVPARDSRATGRTAEAASGLRGWAQRLVAGLVWIGVRLATGIAAELRIRRDTRQLMAMNDDMLKDIGLTRADIADAVRYGRD